ncbi:MAG TPA: hypothetical protein VEK06_01980, partial [Myxococcota bacterium]|nr:hypothetical protein [Myxococcota bacterium]
MRIHTPPMITPKIKEIVQERAPAKTDRSSLTGAKKSYFTKKDANPISRSELATLAQDFKSGKIDREE